MRTLHAGLILCTAFSPLQAAVGEVWRCNGVYTNTREGKSNCRPIEGSKVCGSAGNKYFAPKRMSGSSDEDCGASGQSKSPLVDMEWAEQQSRRGGEGGKARRETNRPAQVLDGLPPDLGSGAADALGRSLSDSLKKLDQAFGAD